MKQNPAVERVCKEPSIQKLFPWVEAQVVGLFLDNSRPHNLMEIAGDVIGLDVVTAVLKQVPEGFQILRRGRTSLWSPRPYAIQRETRRRSLVNHTTHTTTTLRIFARPGPPTQILQIIDSAIQLEAPHLATTWKRVVKYPASCVDIICATRSIGIILDIRPLQ